MKKLLKHVIQIPFKLLKWFREKRALSIVAGHKGEIFIGGKTRLTKNTYLGVKPSFNGMTIAGEGRVEIGDYFHSGVECMIITQNHNY